MPNASIPFLQGAVYYIGSHINGFASRFRIRFSFTSDEIQHSGPCMYDGLRFFPNNRNDEPFIFLHTPRTDSWSTFSHVPIIRAHWLCIKLGTVISIQVEEGSKGSACLRELGAYMYWQSAQISTPGTCGALRLGRQLDPVWRNTVEFMLQRPLMHPKCCFYEGVISSDDSSCLRYVSLSRFTVMPKWNMAIESGLVWRMNNYSDRIVRWRDLCRNNQMGPLRTHCFIMTLALRPMTSCNFHFIYLAHLLNQVLGKNTNITGVNYNKICLDRSCYITPVNPHNMAWEKAQGLCKEEGGNLASINSEREWNFITSLYPDHMPFMNVYNAVFIFIGLHGKVSWVKYVVGSASMRQNVHIHIKFI